MPPGREQSQRMPPQAGHLLSQTACYRPTNWGGGVRGGGQKEQNLKGKEKLRQMCMEGLSHRVQCDGPSIFFI